MAKKRKLQVDPVPQAEQELGAEPLDGTFKQEAPAVAAEDEILPDAEEKPQILGQTTESVPAPDPAASGDATAAADVGDGDSFSEDATAGGAVPEAAVAAAAISDGNIVPEDTAAVDAGGDAVPEASAAVTETVAHADGEDDDEPEPLPKLLEPLSKEQLINLLCEAAGRHADVVELVQRLAEEDPVHRKIFVHGLGWDTTADILAAFFRQYGEIEDLNVVCDKISGKSKGYGFIVFKHRAGARRALRQPQKKIGNRMTACQMASMGPVPPPTPPASEYTQRKIYVSNVSAEVDSRKLLQFFSKYGEIEEGPLGLDKLTGKPKGFALFVYKTVDSARKALEEPHKNFEGHILHCQKAVDGPKQTKLGFHPHHSGATLYHGVHQGPAAGSGAQRPNFTRGDMGNFGHLMAPTGPGAGAVAGFNPAIGQALASLLTTPGAGLGLTNLLGPMGASGMAGAVPNQGVTASMVNSGAHGLQSAYGNQPTGSAGLANSGLLGAYGGQASLHGGYGNAAVAQGGGRGQKVAGHKGGVAPYAGH